MRTIIDKIRKGQVKGMHKAGCACSRNQISKHKIHSWDCRCPRCQYPNRKKHHSNIRLLDEFFFELNTNQLSKAAKFNNKNAVSVGWLKYQEKIRNLLGLTWIHNDLAFANAVAVWQANNGFKGDNVDGKLGKNTWKKMKTILNIPTSIKGSALSNKDFDGLVKRAIDLFGGKFVDPSAYPKSQAGSNCI